MISKFLDKRNLFITIAFLMASAFGADAAETVSKTWKEEVKFKNGEVVTVRREVIRMACCGENYSAGGVVSQNVEFDGLAGVIHWKDDITPVIFDRVGDIYYVVAAPQLRDKCQAHGNPNPPFIFYELRNGAWKQVTPAQFPDGMNFNLLIDWNQKSNESKFLSLKAKARADVYTPHFMNFNKSLNLQCNSL